MERALAAKSDKCCGDIPKPFGDESPLTEIVAIFNPKEAR